MTGNHDGMKRSCGRLKLIGCVAISYVLGALTLWMVRPGTAMKMAGGEYFMPPLSFSEAENARGQLHALSQQWLVFVRVQHQGTDGRIRPVSVESDSNGGRSSDAIRRLEEVLPEFRGTEQEFVLVDELLWWLRADERADHWLDLYMDALHRNPGHPLVGRFAETALMKARITGRSVEVWDGLNWVTQMPADSPSKNQVGELISRYSKPGGFARIDAIGSSGGAGVS
jgi:hypothetical protein